MGPQLDSCGRAALIRTTVDLPTLQWGRNLTVAEGSMRTVHIRRAALLQWGRNLTVAEGCSLWQAQCVSVRFNGAAT